MKIYMPPFIQKRFNLYYARLRIPVGLREHFKKREFFQSLGTTSITEAESKALIVVAGWKRQIAAARGSVGAIEKMAVEMRISHDPEDKPNPNTGMTGKDYVIDSISDSFDDEDKEIRFRNIAMGRKTPFVTFLDRFLEDWDVAEKTKDMASSFIRSLNNQFHSIETIRRPEVMQLVKADKRAVKTKAKNYGFARQYWSYLEDIGVVDGEVRNPFSELNFKAARKQKNTTVRQAFSQEEIESLHQAAVEKGDEQLADLIALGAYTGARIEELCAIKLEDITTQSGVQIITITDSKTDAGVRTVPVHPALKPLIKRLTKNSEDEYLFSNLASSKYGDRCNAIGKRFGRLKEKSGFGKVHVFHSIRKTVITILENAGISEGVTADIVGHEKKTMTYGLYSDGASDKKKLAAIKKLNFSLGNRD